MNKMFPFGFSGCSNEDSLSNCSENQAEKNSSGKCSFHGVGKMIDAEVGMNCSGSGTSRAQDDASSDPESSMFEPQILGKPQHVAEPIESRELKRLYAHPLASFHVLKNHRSRLLRLYGNDSNAGSMNMQSSLSTKSILELAAEKFVKSASKTSNRLSMLNHQYPHSLLGYSVEDSRQVQLILNLLSCAEKLDYHQYVPAGVLLNECYNMSSSMGSPIERLAFYFIEALCEKIDKETGRITQTDLFKKPLHCIETMRWPNTMYVELHRNHPLSQMTKFTGIQAVVDHVTDSRKIHMIDLDIRSGIPSTILIQALAGRSEHPVEVLKITAVSTKSKETIVVIGEQLTSFAESLKLKIIFKIVMVEDISAIESNFFNVEADEAVAVYAPFVLSGMVGRIDQLENVIRVIKDINPCVMVVTEMEANCNSPTFVGRFVESLFFYGAFFDSVAECMKNDGMNRWKVESTCFSSSIRNVLAAEGDERKIRHVSINVWRAFFARVGLIEIELSISSLDQARLVLQSYPCGRFCTVGMNGKCLVVGWKGTPLTSVSAWKFG